MSFNYKRESAELTRATKYAGARLLQTAFEIMQTASDLPGNIITLVQLAHNLLVRPEEAVVRLLRLETTRK